MSYRAGRTSRLNLALAAVFLAFAGAGAASATASVHPPAGCQSRLPVRVLPAWARTGFSDPEPRMPYVLGAHGAIAAILWADPLLAPPAKDHNNKILWVSRRSTQGRSDLQITARRILNSRPTGRPITRRVEGGPGPSIINLPNPGCYQLELHWSHHTDFLYLAYAPNR